MPNYFIVMGDVVKSRTYNGEDLIRHFRDIVNSCNQELSDCILSPYTITLGDEFQGVAKSLHCSVQSVFYLEEATLREQLPFRLRYVIHFGEIVTEINPAIAYEMVGPGLTRARELLAAKRRGRPRFLVDRPDQYLATQLNRLFGVIASLTQEWDIEDSRLIYDMLASDDNNAIANKYGKDRSQIYKRRRTLHISAYKALKAVILDMSQGEVR